MSEAKFTKGPWKFNAYDGSITDCVPAENEIAVVSTEGWHASGMGVANAHLIAAAPEMYEMLQEMIDQYDYEGCAEYEYRLVKSARELLAKARGEKEINK